MILARTAVLVLVPLQCFCQTQLLRTTEIKDDDDQMDFGVGFDLTTSYA